MPVSIMENILTSKLNRLKESAQTDLYLDGEEFVHMERLPDEIYNITKLETLAISCVPGERQKLEITSEIGRLRNLKILIIAGYMVNIPDELYDLGNIEHLYLENIGLTSVSKNIANLKRLKYISLVDNELTELPVELSHLVELESLNLFNNNIIEIPIEIGNLKKLSSIDLSGNPIVNIPPEIVKQKDGAITNYLQELSAEDVTTLQEAKLLIVGEGGVGKTSLVKRLLHESFNDREETTEGIGIDRYDFISSDYSTFKVNVWDFGGQEIYHSTHQFFLTKRSLYLFLWTARNDEIDFDYWLNVVSLLGDDAPILMIQNKIDEREKNIDQTSIKATFQNVCGFHNISVADSTGIDGLEKSIRKQILQLDHVGDTLPQVWIRIREYLEELNEDYISIEEYFRVCESFDVSKTRALYLSEYFHDLGVFLHFQDDDRNLLNEILFLSPDWATSAVYKLVDTREVVKRFGKFDTNLLSEVWSDYARSEYKYLIELMKKFELCFEIKDTNEFVIPELLRADTPEFTWDLGNSLELEYKYEFMPAGIINRLLVLLHHLIFEDIYWRHGMIVEREDAIALITSDPYKKKIKIDIKGLDRRELISIVRERMDYIHRSLNGPIVSERIRCECSECVLSEDPAFFDYKVLKKFQAKSKKHISCPHSTEDVSINYMLGIISGNRESIEEELLLELQLKMGKDDSEATMFAKANEIIMLQPNFMGFGLNLNAIVKRLFKNST